MKKLILIVALISTWAFASTGEEVFNTNCKVCHTTTHPSQIQDKSKLIAPPLFAITKHVKKAYPNKKDFVAFVDDYIQNPTKEKSKCAAKSVERFGVMPAIGKGMSKEDRALAIEYIYTKAPKMQEPKRGAKCKKCKCKDK